MGQKIHPTGFRLAVTRNWGSRWFAAGSDFATMLNELERTGGRYGLQTMCEGGGTANVTIIERL